jgi:hypothetical protein
VFVYCEVRTEFLYDVCMKLCFKTMSWLRWLVASSHLGVSFGSRLSPCEICRKSDTGLEVSAPSASSSQLLLTEGEDAEA